MVRGRSALEPVVGVVLGSGLGGFADALDDPVEIPYAEIPGWPVATAIGHAGTLVLGRFAGEPVAVMRGRAHLYEGHSPDRSCSACACSAGSASGRSCSRTRSAGSRRPRAGAAGARVRPSEPPGLVAAGRAERRDTRAALPRPVRRVRSDAASAAREAAARLGIELTEGVYAAWLGPAFETPAEIRMLRALGADVVGMSLVPEVLAARHMGIRCLALSLVTNRAAGLQPERDRPRARPRGRGERAGELDRPLARARSYTLSVAPRPTLRDLPSVERLLGDPRLAEAPRALALAAVRAALDRARDEIRAGRDPGDLVELALAELARCTPPAAAARAQRDRRDRAHEPRPRAARRAPRSSA